ncbi:kinase-like domain-containing protein [Dimargaris cristalligena]|uniref:mitogen-activated protein kinase kinase n=1 Tax=Dimargaris cristalligena TaxID=215637 RepID=A0A4P9ZZD8_9FUNG|nr:kinase-like domain-containing protein [Dimargaris cristalligena]|eukprot:RKP39144.1 kinase-like domain-containing protein [Dimargaris cristalligena]
MLPGQPTPGPKKRPNFSLRGIQQHNPFESFSKVVDLSGKLNFEGKAVLHSQGVDFNAGRKYNIKMGDFDSRCEIGRGQFGVVSKVFHRPTKVIMALKEIRLQLDELQLNQILMELNVLHEASSPYIVDFYGAFFIESCVYYCMEYMECGSLDNMFHVGCPEDVLARIAYSMVSGLKFLKDKFNIIHRDVKPTNVLVNSSGEIKLCDFGVSGKLNASLAKTRVGCENYMAPERIKSGASDQGYTVQSDIWSLGISLVEMTTGKYPYPLNGRPTTSVFLIMQDIINGPAPSVDTENYSEECRDFISRCLEKDPNDRPSYAQLLEHPYLVRYQNTHVDMTGWAQNALRSSPSSS